MMPNPPAAAEMLLRALLTPASAETMTGDLLEEYRDRRVPALGRLRADFWYVRQVIGVFLRAYGWFAAALILWMVAHDLFNTFRDASGASYLDGLPASSLGPVVGIGVLLAAAAYGSWRTERWHGGVVATAGLFIVLWLFMAFWWSATFYPVAQVQQTNPYWIHAWQWSIHRAHPPTLAGFNPDTPDETFLHWIFWDNVGGLIFFGLAMCVMSSICGVVGSTVSWTFRRLVAR
jgi:hypothetical protein